MPDKATTTIGIAHRASRKMPVALSSYAAALASAEVPPRPIIAERNTRRNALAPEADQPRLEGLATASAGIRPLSRREIEHIQVARLGKGGRYLRLLLGPL